MQITHKKTNYLKCLLLFLFFVGIIGSLSACRNKGDGKGRSIGKLTFALPVADWWTAAPFIISQGGSFFTDNGVELATLEVNSGLASKNAVVAGTADIGLSAATPLALAAARNEGLVVLGAYLRSGSVLGLVRPRDWTTKPHLPEPIAIVSSTISESFLYQYFASLGEQRLLEQKQVKELIQRPADIPSALRNGSAKSAIIWEPFLSFAAEQPGFVVERNAIDFQVSLFLVTRPSVLKEHPEAIQAFLKGVEESCRYLRENSDEARRQVEARFNFHGDFLASTWPGVEYRVTYDLSRMKDEIIREAGVAKALGSISEIPSVDYLFESTPRQ